LSQTVVAVMQRIKDLRPVVPKRIQIDYGSEFISTALDKWAYDNQVTLDFSPPATNRQSIHRIIQRQLSRSAYSGDCEQ
jgi:transposase InsO family protein